MERHFCARPPPPPRRIDWLGMLGRAARTDQHQNWRLRLNADNGGVSSVVQSMKRRRVSTRKGESVPRALRVFAWNLRGPLTEFGKKQIALNVIERGRAWHWTKLPPGWFDLKFCLAHGQKNTKQTLRELFAKET
jgi:hypothetical protein